MRGRLATFKNITLHAVKCKALKFTHLILNGLYFSVSSWEDSHYCHVGPNTYTPPVFIGDVFSLHAIREEI